MVAATERPERLAVFLDCGFCDETFIRQEMTYVDYVRDREVAHVHVLVTGENTGAGGEASTFDLIGRGPFQGMDYSAVYTTDAGARRLRDRLTVPAEIVALGPELEFGQLLDDLGDGGGGQGLDHVLADVVVELGDDLVVRVVVGDPLPRKHERRKL